MKIDVVAVGKVKEKFFRDAISEYSKRLGAYTTLKITEVEDEKTPENASDVQNEQIKAKEAERLMRVINHTKNTNETIAHGPGTDTMIITLEINGKGYTSEGFAEQIADLTNHGVSHLIFVIGGSLGLHETITSLSDLKLSFSQMTFPHQLMRVVLLEQIYRAFRINRGEPYHK